ncbi:PPE family protein [Mycobacterium kansasii]|uniref:PPE family protein n=1 Tax=Mycobacterium kansasii TaxID=1768 RepID=A0A1V3XHB0_MYCKA|nr:PPE family protein [Mycobacterium kansasii]
MVMNYSVLPPEINSSRMFAGAGAAPMLDAAAAWAGLAEELSSAASSFGSLTSGWLPRHGRGPRRPRWWQRPHRTQVG